MKKLLILLLFPLMMFAQDSTLIGDVDCSGEVNSQDASLILQFVTNVIDELPCEANMTGLTPEQRFDRHRQGRLSNRQVQQYGVRLRQDLIDNVGPMTHLESLRLERQLYGRLQSNGYRVYGGH